MVVAAADHHHLLLLPLKQTVDHVHVLVVQEDNDNDLTRDDYLIEKVQADLSRVVLTVNE